MTIVIIPVVLPGLIESSLNAGGSLDHLIRPQQERLGMVSPRALAVLRLMTSSNFARLLDRQSAGLCALEDLVHVGGGAPVEIRTWGSRKL